MMLKNMFAGPDKVKMPKPPSTASAQIQSAETDARRRAMLAGGRQSTIIGGSNLGSIG
jgi:hypothetical protein